MRYKEMLSGAIRESGWSMREIARRCSKSGVSLSQGYLSKLINEDIPPASDSINKALGELFAPVSGIDADALYLAAYKERIPTHVLSMLFTEMEKERMCAN